MMYEWIMKQKEREEEENEGKLISMVNSQLSQKDDKGTSDKSKPKKVTPGKVKRIL